MKPEKVAAVKAAIERALPFVESAAQEDTVYGFFHGGDPRKFSPDPEASTEVEREAHKQACAAFDENKPLPGCCEHHFNDKGELAMIVTKAPFGLGVSVYQDEDAVEAANALKSALEILSRD